MKEKRELLFEILKPSNEEIDKKVIELLDRLKVSGKVYIDKDYIFVLRRPELPVLVAHMDIAHNRPTLKDKYIVANDWYIWSPLGIGGDDRCGVFALFVLADLEVNLLFTHWEEKGGIGASKFIESTIATEIDPCYFIELDRRGTGNWVCYNCDEDNSDWAEKLEKYFSFELGSFSDIAILGRHWKVCSANVAIGFYSEHTKSEYIDLHALEKTIKTIPKLLKELEHKKYTLPEIEIEEIDLDDYYWSRIVTGLNYRKTYKKPKAKNSKNCKNWSIKSYNYWLDSDYEEIEGLYWKKMGYIDYEEEN